MVEVIAPTSLPPKINGPLRGELAIEVVSISMKINGPYFVQVHWWGKETPTLLTPQRRYLFPVRTNYQSMMSYLNDIGQIEFDLLDQNQKQFGKVKIPLQFKQTMILNPDYSNDAQSRHDHEQFMDNALDGKFAIWMKDPDRVGNDVCVGNLHVMMYLKFGEHSHIKKRLMEQELIKLEEENEENNLQDKNEQAQGNEVSKERSQIEIKPVMNSFQMHEAMIVADVSDTLPRFPSSKKQQQEANYPPHTTRYRPPESRGITPAPQQPRPQQPPNPTGHHDQCDAQQYRQLENDVEVSELGAVREEHSNEAPSPLSTVPPSQTRLIVEDTENNDSISENRQGAALLTELLHRGFQLRETISKTLGEPSSKLPQLNEIEKENHAYNFKDILPPPQPLMDSHPWNVGDGPWRNGTDSLDHVMEEDEQDGSMDEGVLEALLQVVGSPPVSITFPTLAKMDDLRANAISAVCCARLYLSRLVLWQATSNFPKQKRVTHVEFTLPPGVSLARSASSNVSIDQDRVLVVLPSTTASPTPSTRRAETHSRARGGMISPNSVTLTPQGVTLLGFELLMDLTLSNELIEIWETTFMTFELVHIPPALVASSSQRRPNNLASSSSSSNNALQKSVLAIARIGLVDILHAPSLAIEATLDVQHNNDLCVGSFSCHFELMANLHHQKPTPSVSTSVSHHISTTNFSNHNKSNVEIASSICPLLMNISLNELSIDSRKKNVRKQYYKLQFKDIPSKLFQTPEEGLSSDQCHLVLGKHVSSNSSGDQEGRGSSVYFDYSEMFPISLSEKTASVLIKAIQVVEIWQTDSTISRDDDVEEHQEEGDEWSLLGLVKLPLASFKSALVPFEPYRLMSSLHPQALLSGSFHAINPFTGLKVPHVLLNASISLGTFEQLQKMELLKPPSTVQLNTFNHLVNHHHKKHDQNEEVNINTRGDIEPLGTDASLPLIEEEVDEYLSPQVIGPVSPILNNTTPLTPKSDTRVIQDETVQQDGPSSSGEQDSHEPVQVDLFPTDPVLHEGGDGEVDVSGEVAPQIVSLTSSPPIEFKTSKIKYILEFAVQGTCDELFKEISLFYQSSSPSLCDLGCWLTYQIQDNDRTTSCPQTTSTTTLWWDADSSSLNSRSAHSFVKSNHSMLLFSKQVIGENHMDDGLKFVLTCGEVFDDAVEIGFVILPSSILDSFSNSFALSKVFNLQIQFQMKSSSSVSSSSFVPLLVTFRQEGHTSMARRSRNMKSSVAALRRTRQLPGKEYNSDDVSITSGEGKGDVSMSSDQLFSTDESEYESHNKHTIVKRSTVVERLLPATSVVVIQIGLIHGLKSFLLQNARASSLFHTKVQICFDFFLGGQGTEFHKSDDFHGQWVRFESHPLAIDQTNDHDDEYNFEFSARANVVIDGSLVEWITHEELELVFIATSSSTSIEMNKNEEVCDHEFEEEIGRAKIPLHELCSSSGGVRTCSYLFPSSQSHEKKVDYSLFEKKAKVNVCLYFHHRRHLRSLPSKGNNVEEMNQSEKENISLHAHQKAVAQVEEILVEEEEDDDEIGELEQENIQGDRIPSQILTPEKQDSNVGSKPRDGSLLPNSIINDIDTVEDMMRALFGQSSVKEREGKIHTLTPPKGSLSQDERVKTSTDLVPTTATTPLPHLQVSVDRAVDLKNPLDNNDNEGCSCFWYATFRWPSVCKSDTVCATEDIESMRGSPVWDYSATSAFEGILGEDHLCFQVWQRLSWEWFSSSTSNTHPSLSASSSSSSSSLRNGRHKGLQVGDKLLGTAIVDISLLNKLPEVSGWYHIVDEQQISHGQLRVTIKLLEENNTISSPKLIPSLEIDNAEDIAPFHSNSSSFLPQPTMLDSIDNELHKLYDFAIAAGAPNEVIQWLSNPQQGEILLDVPPTNNSEEVDEASFPLRPYLISNENDEFPNSINGNKEELPDGKVRELSSVMASLDLVCGRLRGLLETPQDIAVSREGLVPELDSTCWEEQQSKGYTRQDQDSENSAQTVVASDTLLQESEEEEGNNVSTDQQSLPYAEEEEEGIHTAVTNDALFPDREEEEGNNAPTHQHSLPYAEEEEEGIHTAVTSDTLLQESEEEEGNSVPSDQQSLPYAEEEEEGIHTAVTNDALFPDREEEEGNNAPTHQQSLPYAEEEEEGIHTTVTHETLLQESEEEEGNNVPTDQQSLPYAEEEEEGIHTAVASDALLQDSEAEENNVPTDQQPLPHAEEEEFVTSNTSHAQVNTSNERIVDRRFDEVDALVAQLTESISRRTEMALNAMHAVAEESHEREMRTAQKMEMLGEAAKRLTEVTEKAAFVLESNSFAAEVDLSDGGGGGGGGGGLKDISHQKDISTNRNEKIKVTENMKANLTDSMLRERMSGEVSSESEYENEENLCMGENSPVLVHSFRDNSPHQKATSKTISTKSSSRPPLPKMPRNRFADEETERIARIMQGALSASLVDSDSPSSSLDFSS